MTVTRGAREDLTLDGLWDFTHAADGIARQAPVPMPWQAAFADLRQTSGRATYRRRFALPAGWAGRQVVLRFGAVSYFATVRVNGVELARHEGGWLPFEAVLPAALLRADNEVEVECLLPDGDPATAPGAPFSEIPHGKQSWYGPSGGIWQSVTLQSRDAAHLTHCAISASNDGTVLARLTASDAAQGLSATLSIPGAAPVTVTLGAQTEARLHVPQPALWSPDAPNLYTLTVDIAGRDVTTHSFGFRQIATRDGKLWLNGQPFYMLGALDQDYYPAGLATPPSLAFLEDQLRKAKALGLNTLRCHIKIPDPRYYEVADRLGMLIWTEIPNVAVFSADAARRMRETMEGILARDGNHPSICIWTLINEDWGTRLAEDPAHRAWISAEYDWLKARDPSRLVVDNSPCHGNFHVKSDLDDFHWYRSLPERRAEWEALTAEFAAGAAWTYSPHGDAQRRDDEPKIVSEFGVWGLPDPARVTLDGAEPWWMETGAAWGDGAAYPHGIQARFAALGLEPTFGGFEGFINAVQWYQFMNLKYQIESMRAAAPIQGYVITEFTDVHWESNGLLDMNRNPRVFHEQFGTINTDVVIVPQMDRHAGWAGAAHRVTLSVATGRRALPATRLLWQIGADSGEIAVPATAALGVSAPVALDLTLPQGTSAQVARLDLRLLAGGDEVAVNGADIAVYPARAAPAVTLNVPDSRLATYLEGLGYGIASGGAVTVVHALTPADIAAMQAGARYLVLADGTQKTEGNLRLDPRRREQPFIPVVDDQPGIPFGPESQLPNITLITRHGTMWRGDWIAGFSWIRRDGAFAALPGGPLLDLSFDRVVPHHVMTGFRTWEYGGPVQAGLVVGWVHKPAALIASRKVGQGGLVASTFRLTTDAPGADPVAAALTDALIAQAAALPAEA